MLKLAELNAADPAEFAARLAGIFEHSRWIAARTASQRPFAGRDQLYHALCATVLAADPNEQLELIRAHPDLVGRDLLTPESAAEQASADLGELSNEEVERFGEYNSTYRQRFGFPFVICARQNKKQAILDAFPVRLQNSRQQEMETALREIFKIAQLRLQDLVE